MKKIFTLLLSIGLFQSTFSQQLYCDFEGTKVVSLAEWNGIMDSMAVNQFTNAVNSSSMCARYIRDTAKYDNFKFFPYSKLTDVTSYASSTSLSKITMKLYTKAPIGTKVDLQLGARSNTMYPQGIHSEYQALTTAQNAWQTLTFNFVKVPTGSMVNATDIDKIVVLFNPGTNNRDTIWFDDPMGPQLTVIGVNETEKISDVKLYQNNPNPATESTSIKLALNSAGNVSVKLFDVVGKEVMTLTEQQMSPGVHSIDVNTEKLSSGVYFYVVKKGNSTQSMKMVVSK